MLSINDPNYPNKAVTCRKVHHMQKSTNAHMLYLIFTLRSSTLGGFVHCQVVYLTSQWYPFHYLVEMATDLHHC